MSKRHLGLAFVVSIIFCCALKAQELNGVSEYPGFNRVALFRINGENKIARFEEFVLLGPVDQDYVRWLTNDPIRSELKLLEPQIKEIRNANDKLEKVRAKFNRVPSQEANPEEHRKALEAIMGEREAVLKQLREVMVEKQAARLAQLSHRRTLAEVGLETAMSGVLTQQLELERVSLDRLRDPLAAGRTLNQEHLKAAQKAISAGVVATLDARQRRQLWEEVGSMEEWLSPSLSMLCWQLRRLDDKMWAAGLDEFDAAPDCFQVALKGGLEPAPFPVHIPARFDRFLEVMYFGRYGDLDLLSFQIVESVKPGEQERERIAQYERAEANARRRFLRGETTYDDYVFAVNKEFDEVQQWKVRYFAESTLIPSQQEQMAVIVARRLINLRGPHACLINGSLGKLLEVTPEQRDKLIKLAEQQEKELSKETRELDKKVWDMLRESLTKDDQKAFDEYFGPYPDGFEPTCDLLLR